MNRRISGMVIAALTLLAVGSGCSSKKGELRIYSIIHDEETEALAELFTSKTGIPVTYLRATTGELVNRVITEKDAPQADILLGGSSSYHIQAADAGALLPYRSPQADSLPAYARAQDGSWTGFCVLTLGIGINAPRYQSLFPGKPLPRTWDDLLDGDFEGEIVMTDPAASSTAYLFVQGQLQRSGWDAGWDYLSRLSQNVGQFPDSGSAPPKLVGTGEYAIGIAYLHALTKYRAQGFDVQLVSPPESVGEVDCISILRGTPHEKEARQFVDFMLSKEAQELMSGIDFTIPVNPEAKGAEGSVPIADIDLIEYDVQKASAERDTVLSLWSALVD